jgi:hypothetical protein
MLSAPSPSWASTTPACCAAWPKVRAPPRPCAPAAPAPRPRAGGVAAPGADPAVRRAVPNHSRALQPTTRPPPPHSPPPQPSKPSSTTLSRRCWRRRSRRTARPSSTTPTSWRPRRPTCAPTPTASTPPASRRCAPRGSGGGAGRPPAGFLALLHRPPGPRPRPAAAARAPPSSAPQVLWAFGRCGYDGEAVREAVQLVVLKARGASRCGPGLAGGEGAAPGSHDGAGRSALIASSSRDLDPLLTQPLPPARPLSARQASAGWRPDVGAAARLGLRAARARPRPFPA